MLYFLTPGFLRSFSGYAAPIEYIFYYTVRTIYMVRHSALRALYYGQVEVRTGVSEKMGGLRGGHRKTCMIKRDEIP